jgi:ribosomal protein S18 acetylase RimI-like enzyme
LNGGVRLTSQKILPNQSRLNNLTFRVAEEKDIEGIARLIEDNYNNTDSVKEAVAYVQQDLREGMHYIIGVQDGQVIGLMTWKMHDVPKHQLAELHKIAVSDSMKGSGIAKLLFVHGLDHINEWYAEKGQKLRKLYVLTHDNNDRAIAFYKKLGFEQEVIIPNHYYKGVGEVVLGMYMEGEDA